MDNESSEPIERALSWNGRLQRFIPSALPSHVREAIKGNDTKAVQTAQRSAVGRNSRVRARLYRDQKGLCFYCGRWTVWVKWSVDHKIPRSREKLSNVLGGAPVNKVGCCNNCNQAKGNMTFEEFLATDYFPDKRRAELGFADPPTVHFRVAKKSHNTRVGKP
jgi:5-methylcytosine-specific restriction endonuclease McrA